MGRTELQWQDETVYARARTVCDPKDPAAKGEPRVFAFEVDGMRVAVHRMVGTPPEDWFLTCHPLGIRDRELSVKTAEDFDVVKREALELFTESVRAESEKLARAARRCQCWLQTLAK